MHDGAAPEELPHPAAVAVAAMATRGRASGAARIIPAGVTRARIAPGLRSKQPRDVLLLPDERPLEVPELPLALLELGRVKVDAPETAAARDHVMEHLVVDDVRDEVAGHPLVVERRMDADHPVHGAVAAELDRLARLRLRRRALAP